MTRAKTKKTVVGQVPPEKPSGYTKLSASEETLLFMDVAPIEIRESWLRDADRRHATYLRMDGTWIGQLRWVLDFIQRERSELAIDLLKDDSPVLDEALWFSRDADFYGLIDREWVLTAFDSLNSAIAAFLENGRAPIDVNEVTFVLFNRRAAGIKSRREVEVFYRSKDPATRFILAAYRIFELEGKRIARCARCSRLFVRQKRQLFCGPQCSQREQAKRWRERHPGEQKLRQREYYERVQKKKIARINGRKSIAVKIQKKTRNPKETQ